MPYKDGDQRKQAARESMQRKRQGLTPGLTSKGLTSNKEQGLTHLGLTVESMYPSELDIYNRHGIDIRTPVYNRLLAEQRG